MHLLSGLSDDVLTLILDFEPTCAISLIRCGDKTLSLKVTRSCQSFATPQGLELAFCWPRLLSTFPRLRSVNFTAKYMREPRDIVAREVKRLPKSLTRLVICIPDAAYVLYSKFTTQADIPEPLVHLQPISSPVSSLWNVAQYFPRLQELEMSGSAHSTSSIRLRAADLSVFPSSLRKLELPSTILPLSNFSTLPRDLQWLDILVPTPPSTSDLATLPPNLTFLSGVSVKSTSSLKALPRTLTKCSELKTFEESVLPPGLLYFRVTGSTPPGIDSLAWTSRLPRSITEISLGGVLDSLTVPLLPRGITRINGFTQAPIVLEDLYESPTSRLEGFWPPHLHTIDVGSSQFTPAVRWRTLSYLPPTLTAIFNIHMEDYESSEDDTDDEGDEENEKSLKTFRLPSGLRALHLGVAFSEDAVTIDDGYGYSGEDDGDEEEELDEAMIQISELPRLHSRLRFGRLPKSLTHVIFGFSLRSFAEELDNLPSTLAKLEIVALNASSFGALPSQLESLTIENLVWDLKECSFSALPQGLTALALEKPTYTKFGSFPHQDFQNLPPKLYSLELAEVSLEILAFLPTRISRLISTPTGVRERFLKKECHIPTRWLRWLTYHRTSPIDLLYQIYRNWPSDEMLPVPLLQFDAPQ